MWRKWLPMFVPGTNPGGSFMNEDDGGVVVGKLDKEGKLFTGVSCWAGGSSGPIGRADVVPWGRIFGKLLIEDSISLMLGRGPSISGVDTTSLISTPCDPKLTSSTLEKELEFGTAYIY